ncbi:Helicase associated domain protein [Streptomyces sp. NPDC004296]|uniref:DEAD/DEAH box helicase n=1 Tax=Streptomyces sp. NPDC004296 TaxID=3364697 RepID=UPI0036A136B5
MSGLRPYQREAVEAIAKGLERGGRGQLHAACGSGKTRMSVEAASQLVADDGLLAVLVPSLSLVAQTINAWREHARVDAVLAVCSDDTVTDAPAHLGDIDAEVTTDADRVGEWITSRSGRLLIVGTYRSAGRLAEGLRGAGKEADLLVCDEAHHLTGRPDFAIAAVVENAFLPAQRRLYMTATPRLNAYQAETGGLLSMSDETVFGPVLFEYAWAKAIRDSYLDDYRVVIIGVRQSDLLDLLTDDEHHYVSAPGAPDLRTMAAQAVIAKAARQYGLRRILAFCHRLESAREFARSLPGMLRHLPEEQRPAGAPHVDWVSGEMTHAARDVVLETLRTPPAEWTVIANVRCLSEGVDVPAVDAVAFTHPKRSQVDIIQAVGRALRRSSGGSGTATIIVPLVVPDSDEAVGDLEPGEFRTLWQVLRALRAHDETLGIELDTQRSHDSVRSPQLPSRITIELPPGTSEDAVRQLTALTVKQTTSAWWAGYGHARAYFAQHGDLEVKYSHVTECGFGLGTWVANARQHHRKGWLSAARVKALDEIGMRWEATDVPWQKFLAEMRAYRAVHGHTAVPQGHVTDDGYPLGSRVNVARSRSERVPAWVRAALDDLGMIWDTRDLRWQEFYTRCQQYVAEHGHLNVPKTYVTSDGYTLGVRIALRIRKWKEGTLDPAERVSLEELGLSAPVQAQDRAWADFLAACDRYIAVHGSLADVRRDYVDDTGYQLGSRIMYYRNLDAGTRKDGAAIPAQRRAALVERGMVWRIAPRRDLSSQEATALCALPRSEQPAEILRLVDEGVTQTSISEALGMHRSYLNTKIKKLRETGHWPIRARQRS